MIATRNGPETKEAAGVAIIGNVERARKHRIMKILHAQTESIEEGKAKSSGKRTRKTSTMCKVT